MAHRAVCREALDLEAAERAPLLQRIDPAASADGSRIAFTREIDGVLRIHFTVRCVRRPELADDLAHRHDDRAIRRGCVPLAPFVSPAIEST